MNSELLLAYDRFDRESFTWFTLVLHSESIVFSIMRAYLDVLQTSRARKFLMKIFVMKSKDEDCSKKFNLRVAEEP
jgi:hypothetical protein